MPSFARRSPCFVAAALLLALCVACGGGTKEGGGLFAGQRTPAPQASVKSSSPPESPAPDASSPPSASPGASPTAMPSSTSSPTPSPSATPTPAAATTGGARACDDASAARRVRPSVVRIDTGSGGGTGIVATAGGVVVTAAHVVEDVQAARLILADGRAVAARLVAHKPEQDLAVLRADVSGLTAVAWGDERALQVGQPLLALGFPLDIPGEPTLTAGRLSAQRTENGFTLLQTDAPLNQGNSGGPLFTQCGEVVGLVSFGLSEAQGINFAVAA